MIEYGIRESGNHFYHSSRLQWISLLRKIRHGGCSCRLQNLKMPTRRTPPPTVSSGFSGSRKMDTRVAGLPRRSASSFRIRCRSHCSDIHIKAWSVILVYARKFILIVNFDARIKKKLQANLVSNLLAHHEVGRAAGWLQGDSNTSAQAEMW
jgi:hypothetical protein